MIVAMPFLLWRFDVNGPFGCSFSACTHSRHSARTRCRAATLVPRKAIEFELEGGVEGGNMLIHTLSLWSVETVLWTSLSLFKIPLNQKQRLDTICLCLQQYALRKSLAALRWALNWDEYRGWLLLSPYHPRDTRRAFSGSSVQTLRCLIVSD